MKARCELGLKEKRKSGIIDRGLKERKGKNSI